MIIASDLAIVLRNAGRTAESAALLEELVARDPTFPEVYLQLAESYRLQRQFDKAAEQVMRAVQNGDTRPTTQARRAWLYAQTGDRRYAADALTRFRSMQKQGEYVPPLALLEAVTAAGDIDFAFRIIEQAARANEDWVKWIQGGDDSLFKPLTDDPRWQALKPRLAAVITSSTREEFDAAAIGK
jgi:tetratricopeptide (TPR) repeat protein